MRDALKAARDALAESRRIAADALAAVVADERAAFEAWAWERFGFPSYMERRQPPHADEYNNQITYDAWAAWQARARLGSHADAEDAARYRWLRDNAVQELQFDHTAHTCDIGILVPCEWDEDPKLDAAIDAARKEQP